MEFESVVLADRVMARRGVRRMRIATWNVERPKPTGWKIPPAQLRRMAEVDADVWVLTETRIGYAPSADHVHSVFSPEHHERRADPERWTGIWSRWPLTEVTDPAAHRRGTVAAVVHAPAGPIMVYGTVIAWANEPFHDDGSKARMWDVHRAEIDRQGADWAALRAAYPELPVVVAGDFNQDRDGSGWYGTRDVRARLGEWLDRSGLVCVTAMDAVASGLLKSHHLVDHICVTADVAARVKVSCWEHMDDTGQRLSDHPTIAIDWEHGAVETVECDDAR
jgi:endonuclease/exonuclease/phosphatase family metal-dependent hydrolase